MPPRTTVVDETSRSCFGYGNFRYVVGSIVCSELAPYPGDRISLIILERGWVENQRAEVRWVDRLIVDVQRFTLAEEILRIKIKLKSCGWEVSMFVTSTHCPLMPN